MSNQLERNNKVNDKSPTLQDAFDRENIAASFDAYRKLGRADSRTAMPVEVVDGHATRLRTGSAFDKFIELAEAGTVFAVLLQEKPNPLQGFAMFDPEGASAYELRGLAPNQQKVIKENLSGFVVPVVPSLFISQNRLAGDGKILELAERTTELPEGYAGVTASSETLRPAQREAVRKLNAPMSFIWGPLGLARPTPFLR